ncbi:MAG: hypothetical protein IJQ15_11330 [Synergistaceae bacterium]|nr:hypothetical protein [Synergistaceae bacterium]
MKQAIKGASKWLTEHTKRNPIPYKLFKSIVDKQIVWAKSRGVNLDFGELSEAVKAELLKAGIHVMSPDGKQPEYSATSKIATGEESHPLIPVIGDLTLSLSDDEPTLPRLFGWFHAVFDKATAEDITELRFSVNAVKEASDA